MADINKLFGRVNKAKGETISPNSSNQNKKSKTIQIGGQYYEHLRLDVFKHEGTKMTQWANKALEYAIKHKVI